jgi:hypothetical protein
LHLRKKRPDRAKPDDDQDEKRFADVFVQVQRSGKIIPLKGAREFF